MFFVPFDVHLNRTIVVPFVTIVVPLQGLHLWRIGIEKEAVVEEETREEEGDLMNFGEIKGSAFRYISILTLRSLINSYRLVS
jgi:hypothetical protein